MRISKIAYVFMLSMVAIIFLGFLHLSTDTGGRLPPKFFPLNEGDKYVYSNQEAGEENLVTITVGNVKQIGNLRQFEFVWAGKYNDRAQILQSTPEGMVLCENKHLVGEPPLKTIRKLSVPLMMLPYHLKKSMFMESVMDTRDYQGNFVERDNIGDEISFVGVEEVSVEAGKFKCYHFFVRHNYKDERGNSRQMHTYDFWVAPGVGFVKFVHIFIPFRRVRYVKPEEKNIMNRYSNPFVSLYELKEAIIAGKKIAGNINQKN